MSTSPRLSVTARAAAKINLALGVGPLRADGFHELATVYQAVSLYDEVTVRPSVGGRTQLSVEGAEKALVPGPPGNLAVRAAELLAAHHGISSAVDLGLRKAIPVAGGLGGGSADAAAALVACDALWETNTPQADLLGLATRLGSDVPFCLLGGTAVGAGRGEVVNPALARGTFSWVLALAERGLSTPAVYAELDRQRAGESVAQPIAPPGLMAALAAGDAPALGRVLTNDLQPAALRLRPRLRQVVDTGIERGALGATVCGSGPTCAFLTADAEHALDLAVHLTSAGVCRTVVRAVGPVAGARVVR